MPLSRLRAGAGGHRRGLRRGSKGRADQVRQARASWQAVKQNKAELVDGKKGKEWKVTFKNAAAADKSKETLYLFYTPPGNFIAANFTGQ